MDFISFKSELIQGTYVRRRQFLDTEGGGIWVGMRAKGKVLRERCVDGGGLTWGGVAVRASCS